MRRRTFLKYAGLGLVGVCGLVKRRLEHLIEGVSNCVSLGGPGGREWPNTSEWPCREESTRASGSRNLLTNFHAGGSRR